MNQVNTVVWFEIYVQDMSRARSFYETVFQTKLEPLPTATEEDLSMVTFPNVTDAPGTNGALVRAKGVPSGGNSCLVYFFSEDCSTEEARIEEAGGKIMRPKMSIGQYGYVTMAYDTEGNLFGIHSMK